MLRQEKDGKSSKKRFLHTIQKESQNAIVVDLIILLPYLLIILVEEKKQGIEKRTQVD